MSKKTVFNHDWLKRNDFDWLAEVPGNNSLARCTLCQKTFALSNMGSRALNSHAKSSKHVKLTSSKRTSEPISQFFKNSCNEKIMESAPTPSTSTSISPTCLDCDNSPGPTALLEAKRGMASFLVKEEVTKAEILWCLQTVMCHKSLRSAADDISVFKLMCTDSEIAKKIMLKKDKISYTIVYGIAPYFKYELLNLTRDMDFFVFGFDESLNKISQKIQMDINIRFWDQNSQLVVTRYLTSEFLGGTKASDLLRHFKAAIANNFPLKKILQISMDGPNVNFKFLKDLKAEMIAEGGPQAPILLELGSCGLHTIHGCFKNGLISTGWDIISFFRDLYNLFKNVPARRALFTEYTGSTTFPTKFCCVRWLENIKVGERALEMIPHLKEYIEKLEKYKCQPNIKSFKNVKNFLEDPLLSAKISFFVSLASEFQYFLTEYQTDAPLIPFLYNSLFNLMTTFMEKIIRPDLLKPHQKSIFNLDPSDLSNLIPIKEIELNFSTKVAIKKLKLSELELIKFKKEIRKCFQTIIIKLKEKSPLAYSFIKYLTCFDPNLIALDSKKATTRITFLLEKLIENNWVGGAQADKAKKEFIQICSLPDSCEKFKNYRRREERVDEFWAKCLTNSSPNLFSVIKLVLILSHGNANVERGFSINKACLDYNMQEEHLVASRTIFDAVSFLGGIENVPLSKKLIHETRNARTRYAEALENKKKIDSECIAIQKRKREADKLVKELAAKKAAILEKAREETRLLDDEISHLKQLKR